MKFIKGISEISNDYDYFIFDVWGVVHDGSHAYPDVVKTLRFLRNLGKKICFLSNAPRRAKKVQIMLEKFGVTADLYDFILSSGESAFIDLKRNQEQGFKNFGQKYFYIGPNKDLDLLEGLDYIKTEDASQANFAITTGFDNEDSVLAEKLPQALSAKKYNLKMICVNPDMIVVKQNGQEMICAGALAREYEKIGGEVSYYGKPFPAVYKMIMQTFDNPKIAKIIAVGDGLETDIKGANDFGIASLLVSGGIMANQLGIKYWQDADATKLKNICSSFKTFPQFVISNLKT